MKELSNLLEQLRTVHFTLTVACLALVMATEFSTPSTVQRAHQDLIAVQNAVKTIPPTWPEDVARTIYMRVLNEGGAGRNFPRHVRVALRTPQHYDSFVIQPFTVEGMLVGDYSALEPREPEPPDRTVKVGDEEVIVADDRPLPFRFGGDSVGGTKGFWYNIGPARFGVEPGISKFAEAWEFLRRPHVVAIPTKLKEQFIVGMPVMAQGKDVAVSALPDAPANAHLDAAEFGAYTFKQKQGWAYVFKKGGPIGGGCAIAAEVVRYPVDLLAAFVTLARLDRKPDGTVRPLGAFTDAFPELNAVTANYQQLSFDQSRAVIEGELARGGGDFEFLGAKFPAASIGSWGLVILFVLETYFALHLNQVRRVATAKSLESTSGWVGVYRNRPAQILTLASAVVFPCWVAFAVGEFGITNVIAAPSRPQAVLVRLGETSVVGAAMVVCIQLILLWKKASTAPSHPPPARPAAK
jgi:hypothetical protein